MVTPFDADSPAVPAPLVLLPPIEWREFERLDLPGILTPQQLLLLRLHLRAGVTIAQLAQRRNISENAVTQVLGRAALKIVKCLMGKS